MTADWSESVLDLSHLTAPRKARKSPPLSKKVKVQQFYAQSGSVIQTCDEFDLTYAQFRVHVHGRDAA